MKLKPKENPKKLGFEPPILAKVTVANSYIGSLRAVVSVAAWALIGFFLVICVGLWNRSVALNHHEIQHSAEMLEQGAKSYFTSTELFLSTVGNELVHNNLFADREGAQKQLQRITRHQDEVSGLGFLTPDGDFWVTDFADLDQPLPSVLSNELAAVDFRRYVETPQFHIGRPYFFEYFDTWIIPIRSPIYDDEGELLGFVTLGVELEKGLGLWTNVVIPDGIQVSLVRPDHHLTYLHPLTLNHTLESLSQVYLAQISPELQELMTEEEGVHQYQRRRLSDSGIEQAYAYLKPLPEYNLTVVAMRSRSNVIHSWLLSLLIPLTVLIAAFLALWFAAKRARFYLETAESEINFRQNALIQALEQYGKLTALTPAGVYQLWIPDSGPRELIYLSHRARELFNIPPEMPLSETLEHIIGLIFSEDIEGFISSETEAIERNQPLRWEGRFLLNNQLIWVSVDSQPGDHDGKGRIWHGVMLDVTERRAAQEQIEELAHYDVLTHLPNRTLLQKRMNECIRDARSKKLYSGVLSVDLDNFKILNDSLGHEEGDRALLLIAQRLSSLVEDKDTVAHMSADEFIVLLADIGATEDEAIIQCQEFITQLNASMLQPLVLANGSYLLTASIGVTLVGPDSEGMERVLQQADQAMYEAKDTGRNTSVFFDSDLAVSLNSRLELQRDLHRGIADNELDLFYQPKVNCKKHCVGVEALVRWFHPTKGMVSPAEFIHIAEQSGDIILLGNWVLRTACEKLVAWANHPERSDWTMSVNVSVKQLKADNFVEEVSRILAETGAPPNKLILEITESMLVGNTEAAIVKMQQLREVGVRFALDDFGTGYSNLNYLQKLPLDQLKIDRSFVSTDADKDDAGLAHEQLTRSIISLGHTLGLIVVAEGVETDQQFQGLIKQGCEIFQGFYFSPPVREKDLP